MVIEETLLELDQRLGSARMEVDAPLAPLTTFRIGGPADRLFHARTADDLAESILAARDLGITHFLLGRGANVLVGDRGFRGLVIHCEVGGTNFLDDGRVRAGAARGDLSRPYRGDRIPADSVAYITLLEFRAPWVGPCGRTYTFSHPRLRGHARSSSKKSSNPLRSSRKKESRRTVNREYFQFGYDYSIPARQG